LSDAPVVKEMNASGTKGRFVIKLPEGVAELTFSVTTPTLIIADHTGVDPALEGQGLAKRLVEALIADARQAGYRIVPLCPYVNAQRRRHPEWADVFSV